MVKERAENKRTATFFFHRCRDFTATVYFFFSLFVVNRIYWFSFTRVQYALFFFFNFVFWNFSHTDFRRRRSTFGLVVVCLLRRLLRLIFVVHFYFNFIPLKTLEWWLKQEANGIWVQRKRERKKNKNIKRKRRRTSNTINALQVVIEFSVTLATKTWCRRQAKSEQKIKELI